MTIDAATDGGSVLHRLVRGGAILSALLAVWFGSMVLAMATLDVSDKALVFGPSNRILGGHGDELKIVSLQKNRMVVTSSTDGYVRRLNRAGAWIVLPSLNAGCLVLRG